MDFNKKLREYENKKLADENEEMEEVKEAEEIEEVGMLLVQLREEMKNLLELLS